MSTELGKDISPKKIYIANKHVNRCSASLVIREVQIKPTMRRLY